VVEGRRNGGIWGWRGRRRRPYLRVGMKGGGLVSPIRFARPRALSLSLSLRVRSGPNLIYLHYYFKKTFTPWVATGNRIRRRTPVGVKGRRDAKEEGDGGGVRRFDRWWVTVRRGNRGTASAARGNRSRSRGVGSCAHVEDGGSRTRLKTTTEG
jgi:hypothetical protein